MDGEKQNTQTAKKTPKKQTKKTKQNKTKTTHKEHWGEFYSLAAEDVE